MQRIIFWSFGLISISLALVGAYFTYTLYPDSPWQALAWAITGISLWAFYVWVRELRALRRRLRKQ